MTETGDIHPAKVENAPHGENLAHLPAPEASKGPDHRRELLEAWKAQKKYVCANSLSKIHIDASRTISCPSLPSAGSMKVFP